MRNLVRRVRSTIRTSLVLAVCLAGIGLPAVLLGNASPARADTPSCSIAGGDSTILGCGVVDSKYAYPNLQGQTFMSRKNAVGQYFQEIHGANGDVITVQSRNGSFDTIYRSQADRVYEPAAVRQNMVSMFADEYNPAAAPRPTVPASAAAATVESGATTAGAAAAAENASNTFSKSRVLSIAGKAGKTAWNGFAVLSTADFGYQLGNLYDSWACSEGASLLCTGNTNPSFAPNGDVGEDPKGWAPYDQPWSYAVSPGWKTATETYSQTYLTPNSQGTDLQYLTRLNSGTSIGLPHDFLNAYTVTGTGSGGYNSIAPIVDYYCVPNANGTGTAFACGSVQAGGLSGSTDGGYSVPNYTPNGSGSASATNGGYFAYLKIRSMSFCCTTNGASSVDSAIAGEIWYPPGNPNVPSYNTNPSRYFVTTNSCADGTSKQAQSATFHETDAKFPSFPTAAACASNTTLTEVKTVELGGASPKTVYDQKVPQAIQDFHNNYPECASPTTVCTLDLAKIAGAAVASGVPALGDCFETAGLCDGWFQDPNKSTDYQCSYGPASSRHNVALSECNTLSPTFDAAHQANGTTTGDPRDGSVPKASDPVEGTTSGDQPDPSDPTSTDPDPGSDDQGDGSPGALPSPENCWPTGWGVFNPLAWIYQPVKCVLTWAFVPNTQQVVQEWSDTWDDVQQKPPFSVITPMVAFVGGFAGGLTGACSGETIADFGHGLTIPCVPPANLQTFVTTYKIVIDVILFGVTAFALWRMLEQSAS